MLGDWINTIFQSIMLWLDSVIYWFAAQCYQLFMKLSVTQIFDENFFNNFATRIYSILGVFMLFYLAYALLNALVDPDKLTKGDKSVSKIAQNLVVSLVILGLLPSIFSYAYRLQNYILSSNVIGSLIFGTPTIDPTVESDDSLIRYGDAISFTVLNTFLNSDDYNVRVDNNKTWYDIKYEILHDGDYSGISDLDDSIVHETTDLSGKASQDITVDYKLGISSIAGLYLCYIMLSFTLDLGVRVVKLAFCQLIAPIPVVMRAVPGKNGTFDKWLKLTLSVYFEIFVRVAFMYIAVYFINGLTTSNVFDNFFSGGIQGMLALVIIILGILTFAKQAPKMISDILGLDTGNMKLGIGDKIKGSLDGLNSFGFARKAVSYAGKATIGRSIGTVTGGLGGLATGVFDKNVNTWAAFRQGFSGGFKKGGNQFKAQRSKTFESYYGYGKEEGLLGGLSFGQKFADANKDAVNRSRIDRAQNIANKYENSWDFNTTFQIELDDGSKYETIFNNLMHNSKVSQIFRDADAAADRFAMQNNIDKSDARYQKFRDDYISNIEKNTSDSNLKRALETVISAQNKKNIWDNYNRNIIANMRESDWFKLTDANIDANTVLTDDEKALIKEHKKEWLASNFEFTKGLANGTYTRDENGKIDAIYNREYKEALDQLGKSKPDKESTEDLLRKLINKK